MARLNLLAILPVVIHGLKYSERSAFKCRYDSRSPDCRLTVDDIGRFFIFESNGLPDHAADANARPQTIKLVVPKTPLALQQGMVGLALNGVPIYNSQTMACCDAAISNLSKMDTCNGLADKEGIYRYHIYPKCLEQCSFGTRSGILGVALDGFPIYGPIDDDGAQLTSKDLDECHGKWHGHDYRYHVTADYPYFIGCFRGRVPAQNKATPVRRYRRSYSWREGERLPSRLSGPVTTALKMGDCKTCSRVDVCNKFSSNKFVGKIEENRRIASTRTINSFPKYTPEVQIKSSSSNNDSYQYKPPSNFWGGFSQNKKSLFSVYTPPKPATSPAPKVASTTAPKTTRSIRNLSVGNMWLNPIKRTKSAKASKTTVKPPTTHKPKVLASNYNSFARKENPIPARNQITKKPIEKKTTAADLLTRYTQLKSGSAKSSPTTPRKNFQKKAKPSTKRTTPNSYEKAQSIKSPIEWDEKDLRQMLEDTSVTKVGKKIDPLEAILSGLHSNPLNVKKSGDSNNIVGESVPFGAKAGSVDSLWGKVQPRRIPRKLETELLPTVQTTTTTRVPTTTTPMWWRYTSTLPQWAKEALQSINRPKKYSEYVWVNGHRRRVPDNVRTKLEKENAEKLPENRLRELESLVSETKMYNNALRDHFENGRRRRRRSTKDAVDIYDELQRVLLQKGISPANNFLMKKDGITVLKCESPRFLTPDPEDVHPQQMSPELLEEMLRERKDIFPVKQSVFSRLFD